MNPIRLNRRRFLKLYFNKKLEHNFITLEGLEKMKKAGYIKYVSDNYEGYWKLTEKDKEFIK